MKYKIMFFLLILIIPAAALSACEFIYMLGNANPGNLSRITPGSTVTLEHGKTYILTMSYREDHRNCEVSPEDTLFLVEEERWRTGKDYLGLELISAEEWKTDGRVFSVTLTFKANRTGTWPLEIIRECTRGGYEETISFSVI